MKPKPDRTFVYEKLTGGPPYIVEITALDAEGNPVGGEQRHTADTLEQMCHSLAKAYAHLFSHLKIMKTERVKLYAEIERLQKKPRSSGLSTR